MNGTRRALRNVDLNLLLAFEALVDEGSVTRAAQRIRITQPAMSNALKRLRETIGDPLFIRDGRSLVTTARARELAPIVRRTLNLLDGALFNPEPFDPGKAEGIVRLGLSDYWHFALLPSLLALLEQRAPGVSLEVTDTGLEVLREDLRSGNVDAAIYLAPISLPELRSRVLVDDGYACVVQKRHPTIKKRITLAEFAASRQVMVAPRGPWAERMSNALAGAGLHSEYILTTTHLQVALEIVARTDYLTVIPKRIATRARRAWPIRVLPMPIDAGRFSLALYWHERTDADPLQAWVRDRFSELARKTYLDPAVAQANRVGMLPLTSPSASPV